MNDINVPKYKTILPLLNCNYENNATFIGKKLPDCIGNESKRKLTRNRLFRNAENMNKTIVIKKLVLPPIKLTPQKYKQLSKLKTKYNTVTNTVNNPKINYLKDNFVVFNRFYRLKIHEEILKVKRHNLELSKKADKKLFYLQPLKFEDLACIGGVSGVGIDEYLFNHDCHVEMVASMIQRLQRIHLREKTKFKAITDNIILDIDFMEKNSFNIMIKHSSTKNFGTYKMKLEQNNVIPNLLRVSRQPDKLLLNILLKNILIHNIGEISLNIQDVAGRTALSYLACNPQLTKYMDLLFQIPGIEANQPDNKGNIPLHYATKSGSLFKKVLINLDSLSMNVKNGEGVTPLMKLLFEWKNNLNEG